jgi:hypothetical protein
VGSLLINLPTKPLSEPPVILTQQEDGSLTIYTSVADAVRSVEALDAEESFLAIFDETGQPYAVHWIRPNKRGRIFAANGEYTLLPSGLPDPAALLATIRAAKVITPESAVTAVQELAGRLAGPGQRAT